jgi:flagellar protein FlaG
MEINSIAITTLPVAGRSQQPSGRTDSVAAEQGGSPIQASKPSSTAPLQDGEADPAQQPMEDAVSSIQQFVQTVQRNLNFSLDDSSGRVVVKVTDGVSGEVIRQIPSEEALRLAESLEQARSLLFKAEA